MRIAGLAGLVVLGGCVSQAKYEYLPATSETVRAEIALQQDVLRKLPGNLSDTPRDQLGLLYELHSRHGFIACRPDGSYVRMKDVRLEGRAVCGNPLSLSEPIGPPTTSDGEVCLEIGELSVVGSPRQGSTFGYYPNTSESVRCPDVQ